MDSLPAGIGADIVRCEFPDPEPTRGAGVLRVASSLVVEPLRRDLRVLVYPFAVVMAVAIGLLGHYLGPIDGPAAASSIPSTFAVEGTSAEDEPSRDETSDATSATESTASDRVRSR